MCPPMWAHWRHRRIWLNLCFLWPTRVHNPNVKSIGSAVFAQQAVECRRIHWRHLANTTELVLPSAHASPQPKWQIDRFIHLCTAHGRKSLYITIGNSFLQKLSLLIGRAGPHLTHMIPLAILSPRIQTSSRSVQPFSHRWLQSVPIFYNVTSLCHSKLPLPIGDLDPI